MPATTFVKMLKLNNLQYNPNRDPQVYRRCVNEPFRIQALLEGKGAARCVLKNAEGTVLAEKSVALPGTFTHELRFPTAGVRVVTLTVEANGRRYSQDLRLDVLEHAWEG
ncbi:MAG: hypothetical protein HYU77_06870 [Betaproteobacteria bacterium]|nr:hypothetical protein [Betaproteobacteria bacterium]